MPASPVTVSEYNNFAAVSSLRDLWRDLWWKTRRASFFQSFEAFESQCRQPGGPRRLRVLVVSVGKRPIGILPLVIRRLGARLGRARLLTDAIDGRGFFWGALGPNPRLTLDAALRHIASTRRDWDMLKLSQPDDLGMACTRTSRLLWRNGFEATSKTTESRAIVECCDDWVHYLASRPAAARRNYRHCEERLAARGNVELVRYRPEGTALGDDDPRWDLFNELDPAATVSPDNSRRSRGREANLRRSLRETHSAAASIAGIDLNVLTLSGRPIAWAYNYRCDGRIEMQQIRAVPEFMVPASTVLLGRMLRDGFRRGDESYLLDAETARDAAGWQTADATVSRFSYYAPRAPRAQAFRLIQWLKQPANPLESVRAAV